MPFFFSRPLMNGIPGGSASFRITRPTVVEMYCLLKSTGSVCVRS